MTGCHKFVRFKLQRDIISNYTLFTLIVIQLTPHLAIFQIA